MDNKEYKTQFKKVFEAFKEKPKTRLQVAVETNILRGNVCYFVRDLRQRKQITVVKKGKCPISKHRAEFLSTDEKLLPKPDPELFPVEMQGV